MVNTLRDLLATVKSLDSQLMDGTPVAIVLKSGESLDISEITYDEVNEIICIHGEGW